MEGGRPWTSGVALMALVLTGLDARPARAQEDSPPASGAAPAIREADLAALGSAARWRALIVGDARKLPPHERVILTDAAGRILLQAEGSERRIEIPPTWVPLLIAPDAGLVLAHNHPAGQSLSSEDLSHFDKRGIATMVVIGHDGSLYAAAKGPSYRDADFEALYMAASREVTRQVRLHKVEANAFLAHRNHLVALALARAEMIVYRADLAHDRWRAFNSYAALCDDIVRAAEAAVRRLLGG
jgi:hypothetical protein